jgi:hypothetical protein
MIGMKHTILQYPYPYAISLLFFFIAAFGMYNHEMWRDEMEMFMIMRDFPHFIDLFPTHRPLPSLYLLLLFPFIKIFPYSTAYQIFHLLIIVLAVFLFNKYSPFNILQKTLFTFSYFVIFEYGIISREYSTLLLYIVLLVILITRNKQNFIAIAVMLVLLANHRLFGAFIALSVTVYLALHIANRFRTFTAKEKRNLFIAVGILAIGGSTVLFQYYLLTKFNRYASFGQAPYFMTLRSVWNVFLPIPATTGIHFWNSNIFPFPESYSPNVSHPQFVTAGNIISTISSLFLLFASIMVFSKKLPVLITYLLNTAIQLLFLQYLSVFYIRYQGPLFIIFVYNYWLLSYSDERLTFLKPGVISGYFNRTFFAFVRKITSPFLTVILFVQFCTGIFVYIQDMRYPFTASYKAARYIKKNELNKHIMVGYMDFIAQAIAGHLNEKIYYPQSSAFGTNVSWPDRKAVTIPLREVINSSIGLINEFNKNILLILHFPIMDNSMRPLREASISKNINIQYLDEFTETVVQDERYFLYLIYRTA